MRNRHFYVPRLKDREKTPQTVVSLVCENFFPVFFPSVKDPSLPLTLLYFRPWLVPPPTTHSTSSYIRSPSARLVLVLPPLLPLCMGRALLGILLTVICDLPVVQVSKSLMVVGAPPYLYGRYPKVGLWFMTRNAKILCLTHWCFVQKSSDKWQFFFTSAVCRFTLSDVFYLRTCCIKVQISLYSS